MAKANNEFSEEFPDVLPDANALSRRWTWKEDTNSLELISNPGVTNIDKNGILAGKNKRGKPGTHGGGYQEGYKSKLKEDRKAQSTYGGNIRHLPSPKSSAKLKVFEDRTVTLEDVKGAAMDLLSDVTEISNAFKACLNSPQFDDFLLMLLYYFEAFLERLCLENKPKPMATEPSVEEKAAIALQVSKQDTAKKLVAEKYSTLLLGLGMHEQHHMACGRQRKSHTRTDRKLYETLYRFCVFALWITFKRQELKLIENEVGHLFRSDTFNPNSREEKKEEFKLASDLAKSDGSDFNLAPTSSSRNQKRPAITSIVNQRSPVLVSLLPTSQDSGGWLLSRRNPMFIQMGVTNSTDIAPETVPVDEVFPTKEPRVGIIGDSFAGYNPVTLAPFGEDHDENASIKRSTSTDSHVVFEETEDSSSKGID